MPQAGADDAALARARHFVRSRNSVTLPIDADFMHFLPRADAFILHALNPTAGNPTFFERIFGAAPAAYLGSALFAASLVAGGCAFVSQEWSSAQGLLTVPIRACAAPTVAGLTAFSRANCVSDALASCESAFAGPNPDLAAEPLSLTYRQTRSNIGFTIILLASATALAAELVYLQAVIARRQALAARILPFHAYLRHVRLPCAREESWDKARGGGECCACCGGRVRCNRWGAVLCCGRSVAFTTVLPQLVLTALIFVAYYCFKTLSIWQVVTNNAFQAVVETVEYKGSALRVNTVRCLLSNGTAGAPLRLLLDVDGAARALLGGGTFVFGFFPQVLLALSLVALAFVPQLYSLYSVDGDVLAGVPLRGFVHCLDAAAGAVACAHHPLSPRPKGEAHVRAPPGILTLGARTAESDAALTAALEPTRFVAVDEALLDEVLWDLLAARGARGKDTGRWEGPCARRRRFCAGPAAEPAPDAKPALSVASEDRDMCTGDVRVGELLLEAALRAAHADEPADPANNREVRLETLARTLCDAAARALRADKAADAAAPARAFAAQLNPIHAARGGLPRGWTEVSEDGLVWYAHEDGRTPQWTVPVDE